ncbi:MAG: mechanosensitive ion channel [Pirellulaceae bacterium]|nr:mechanosensitive ion channel [Pirellulaceae bacterium]
MIIHCPQPAQVAKWISFLSLLTLVTTPSQLPAQLKLPTTTASHASKVATSKAAPLKDDSNISPAEITESRHEIAAMITRVQQAVQAFKQENPDQPIPESADLELELLKWLDLLYANHSANLVRKGELQAELSRVRDEVDRMRIAPTGDRKRYSFLMLDTLRDQLNTECHRLESIELEIEAARSSHETAKKQHSASESRRRLTRESLDSTNADDQMMRKYAMLKLRSRGTAEAVRQRQIELEINELEHQVSEQKCTLYRDRIDRMRGSTVFTQKELNARIAITEKAESDLRQQLEIALANLTELEQNYLLSTRTLENAVNQTPALVETANMWRLLRELNQEHVSVLQRVIGHAGTMRIVWRRRFDLANDQVAKTEIAKWTGELENVQSEISQFERLLEIRSDERVGDMATVRKRLLTSRNMPEDVRPLIERQSEELEQAISAYNSQIVLIKSAGQTLDRFRQEVEQSLDPKSAQEWIARLQQVITTCWNYEITSVDDRPITVGKILWGTILLLMGIYSARISSRILGTRLLPRFGLNQGAAVAFQSIAFYMLVTCFGFIALEIINLPLTVFAFMGGAIAIGVGFGSQNVLNNFISGLIMLAERPVRVGDMVDIEGLNGVIERIGARSTRVKTGSNLEIIVPNSKFLENNVTNWTLSDTRIRTVVRVGVAYGSPVEQVCRLVRESVLDHAEVLKTPAPIILFKDFGDNALMFEAHFWIHMRTQMEGERIASDVRVTMDRLFEQANIVVAFPQRDVHVDTSAPIEVNLRQISDQLEIKRMKAA